ncbi:tRNA 2-thiouridine(34) synthase MnmA [Methylocystis sp. MJC1]|jgi:tRNA-specific 2-thiouridylase|uniref:tRNA 2-thiouridine(34) synthase MnmA n=1 Tax=Methylocystis sp. MJC1 TaxID=2654282 RepID=UPI0013EDB7C5|nr:tRNA 2-thiouridine(34) synthase MnmA [Methylocystis sp. MJC1]KAF2990939.1 tRNA-specific 2-thiouridylase MnmA [Methylocystis sp. MJC1]MBU6527833.1 tRNA 2-thiouridine(34) synthase MnmA [Methylocystis sp. MJC1]UZX10759.1 tRNA 2-thiouridine(34) synthase MnmA [Methylocystis sp. MJC1]
MTICTSAADEISTLPASPGGARAVVAMSGGVDSSVVAALLKEQGYDVVGVTLQLYDHGEATHRKGACCAGQDIQDARAVAARLGIPHFVLDYERRFHERVIEEFAASYASGETPVPCIACNQFIKFADLFETAKDLGADILATGHYISSRDDGEGGRALYRAKDASRDQSYFLFATTREQLKMLRFPLGDYTKTEVRDMARRFSLDVADKPDSQDICFVPSGRYTDIVQRLAPQSVVPGEIVHIDGRVLGRHAGVVHYTIGQRRGLGLGAAVAGRDAQPLFVVRIDAAKAQVVVGPREALETRAVALRDVNWIGPGALSQLPPQGIDIMARVRSTRPPVPARLVAREGKEATVVFATGEFGVSPGQACVFYDPADDGARVLGGGFIAAVEPARQSVPVMAQTPRAATAQRAPR